MVLSDLENNGQQRVLHVAPLEQASAREMAEVIRQSGCEVVAVGDVYRALARLGRMSAGDVAAVIVCLDRLTEAQLEFIQLASRQHRGVPVYVYGQPQARSKIDAAVRLGAAGAVDAARLDRVFSGRGAGNGRTTDASGADEAVDEPEGADLEVSTGGRAVEETEPVEAAEPIEPVAAKSTKPGSGSTVRVPWLRYDDRPQRTPPKKAPSKPPTPEPPAEVEPPLLSPEELEALMGEQSPEGPSRDTSERGGKS